MRIRCSLRLGLSLTAILIASGVGAEEPVEFKSPRVLWAYKASEHFVAAPVAGKHALYVSGLGAFNTGVFQALALDPHAERREVWSLTAPDLKLPVVSSPAVVDEKLYFGSGMHQTDGAVLYCAKAATGRSIWQMPVAGQLVHLEGSPLVADGRLYIGGGNAGVLAVDITHGTLEGREHTLAEIETILDKRWRELEAEYEDDKRRDPDLAFPPNPDALPKATPKLVWNAGKNRWHVDASIGLAGDRLLVNSAFLDNEQLGERAVICLQAADGKVLWKTPLKYNPWSAPVVSGNVVVVAGSSIRLDPNQIAGAKGEVMALDLKSGDILWRQDLPGGVVSPCAVRGRMTVFTATDGKVRAFDLSQGNQIWSYDAGTPIFAGAVIAGETVYVADLNAIVHAVTIADGKRRWTCDLSTDPAVQAPGMVYGTPLLHDGRLYIATCNLGRGDARRLGAVVCLGER
jgi:outer membrane protein assembly factor BamB